jgi:hypothetical protein
MERLMNRWSPAKTRRLLQALLVIVFGFLFVRSLLEITDHQTLLDDLGKDEVLRTLTFEDDQLLVNPDDWCVIRTQIDRFEEEGTDLELRNPNTAVFYDRVEQELRVLKIRDLVIGYDDQTEVIDGTEYLVQRTPEELFGTDMLLVRGGSGVLGDALGMVRGYAKGEVAIEDYDALLSNLSRPTFLHILMYRHDIEVRHAARALLERFHPDRTLYVNDASWITGVTDFSDVKGIVFDEGIETIPSFDRPGLENMDGTLIRLSEVVIPSSVKSIASGAFPFDVFEIRTMRLNCLEGLYMEQGSIDGVDTLVYDITLFKDSNTIDFSDEVRFEIGAGGEVTFGFDNLTPYIHQYGLNGYTLKREKNIMVLYLYTNDFLIGFARNAYITTYYAREGDRHPYHVRISHEKAFVDITHPDSTGTVMFEGWVIEGALVQDGDPLESKTTIIHGTWSSH